MSVKRIEFAPALMTREAVAYYIGGSLREVDELRAMREITAVGDGKRVRFRKTDIDAWISRLKERR